MPDPLSVLRAPRRMHYSPDNELRACIARYLRILLAKSTKQIKGHMPAQMPLWGGVRINYGGDVIRCASAVQTRHRSNERDASYIRVSTIVYCPVLHAHQFFDLQYEVVVGSANRRTVYYGRLEKILECNLPDNDIFWGDLQGSRLLLAVITPCVTTGRDATQTPTFYRSEQQSQVVVDLRTVQGVVGRVSSRGKWCIIDRSHDIARTVFVDNDDDE